jgi:hypothetical protein
MKNYKYILAFVLFVFSMNVIAAQNNVGNIYNSVKTKRNKLKDIKEDIAPKDNNEQTSNTTPSDTADKNNPKQKKNLAVGDEGVTEDKQNGNKDNTKKNQVKGFVKSGGDNTTGTKNNLAVGDQGVTEDQEKKGNNKTNNTQITPK